jgi:Na+-transporting NADH:ubiquinone oxidoreductase subunit F
VAVSDRFIFINDDTERIIHTSEGNTLLSGLAENGIYLPSACGGRGICGTCKCAVKEGGGAISPVEQRHIGETERKNLFRLACQIKVTENIKINLPDQILGIKKYSATVISNDNVTPFIKELILKLDNDKKLNFKSGAYVQIDIPGFEISFKEFSVDKRYRESWDRVDLWSLKASSEEPVFRAYSLANPPSEKNMLRFTIRIATPPAGRKEISPGISSSYIFSLKPGDNITLTGPYGDFFIKNTEREMCFIGGGAGMAPMRSHILDQLLTVKTKRKITFWYGARSKQDLFYADEFMGLENKFGNFKYHVALSEPQPEERWEGLTGFIHQCLYDNYLVSHKDPSEIEYYLCGPPMMINAAVKMLEGLGVKQDMIAYDKFG